MYNRSNISNRSNRLNRLNKMNLAEAQQSKNNYVSRNFYLLPEPGFPDQEHKGGANFLTASHDYMQASNLI